MFNKRILSFVMVVIMVVSLFPLSAFAAKGAKFSDPPLASAARKPFPQHVSYAVNALKPSGTQAELDAAVVAQFKKLLVDFIKDPAGPEDDFRMVLRHGSGGGASAGQVTCSESMGYGMLMLAYMAGQDAELGIDVHAYFDGMFRSLMHWPSVIQTGGANHLMAWELVQETAGGPFVRLEDGDNATDGDLDMAFALLLADQQWGSDGRYNYREYAEWMINDLWRFCVDSTGTNPNYHLKIADWATGSKWSVGTRPSDFCIDHLKAFKAVDKTHDWQKVIDATYECIRQLTARQSPVNGLLPDFAVFDRASGKWSPAPPNWLEGSSDERYAANSCRTPWRLGTDYLMDANDTIKDICVYPLNEHIRNTSRTPDDMTRIYAGYNLDGTGRGSGSAGSMYISPFLVTAAAFGPQAWLDSGWEYAKNLPRRGDNYGDYINVLTMIVASGNWWSPIDAVSPEYPLTAIDWILQKMDSIDVEANGYGQYDDIFQCKAMLANRLTVSDKMKLTAAEINMFMQPDGQYYDKYQKLLDDDAKAVAIWLEDLATQKPGESWQDHYARVQGSEYMFTEAPGIYRDGSSTGNANNPLRGVEPGRRISILGADKFEDNKWGKILIELDSEIYPQKFQEECYRPAKLVEAMIDDMDPQIPSEVQAVRAAYDELDMLSRSCIMNYQLLTRAEGQYDIDENGKLRDFIPENLASIGMRKPTGADTGFTANNHKAALSWLQECVPGATPWYIWIAGTSNGVMRIGLPDTDEGWATLEASGALRYPIQYYKDMGIVLSDETGAMDEFFTYLDTIPGSEVFLQVENMWKPVEPQMDVLNYVAKQYACVKGFAIDVEWYGHGSTDMGLPVTDYRAKILNEQIYQTWGPKYQLALKHYNVQHLPSTYRGGDDGKSNQIVFVDDTQNYGSWDGSHGGRYNEPHIGDGMMPGNGGDWALFAQFLSPNPMIFQTGYQQDPQWTYAFGDPLIRSYSIKCAEVVNPGQNIGIAWVNFNRQAYREFPSTQVSSLDQKVSALGSLILAKLADYNGDSNNMLGGNFGYYSNAAGATRLPATVYDCLVIRNTRIAAQELEALGANLDTNGFLKHPQYNRFLEVESKACEIRIKALPPLEEIASKHYDKIKMLWETYEDLTAEQQAAVPSAADLIAAYNKVKSMSAGLVLSTEAHNVQQDGYANITTGFAEAVQSNTAILSYSFNTELFELADFHPADGVTVISKEATESGAKIVVMIGNYETQTYGQLALHAKADAKLSNSCATVSANVEYVVRDENGDKEIQSASASTTFTTRGDGTEKPVIDGDTNADGKVDLIDLSNMIDWMGIDQNNTDWNSKYTFFDFNNNGEIDIYDVVYVARLIV